MRPTAAFAATFAFAAVAAGCGDRDDQDARAPAGTPPAAGAAEASPVASPRTSTPAVQAPGGTTMTTKATVGQPAPDFRAKDQTGKERTLAEFRGKRVVLWFFPKADTPG
jgi:hypothetical protein